MSLAEELPVYKAGYDLVLAIFEQARGFRKEYKYTIGESLKNETIALITNIGWPREQLYGKEWYQLYGAPLFTGGLLAVGVAVYLAIRPEAHREVSA